MVQRQAKILFLLLIASSHVYAQQPAMWHISTEDGLETETVYDLVFDDEGRAWMGTYGGLVSFEGIEASLHHGYDLETRTCTNLQFDQNGDIYYTNFANEIYRYDISEDSSYLLKGNPLMGISEFGDYYINEQNEMWLTASGFISKGEVKNDSFYLTKTIREITRSKFIVDETGTPWITLLGEARINKVMNLVTAETISLPGLVDYKGALRLKQNEFWYVSHYFKNISHINIQTKKESVAFLKKNQDMGRPTSHAFLENQLWIGTTNGLFIADSSGVLLDEFSQPLFPGSTISKIDRDLEGNTWIASTNDGIWVLPNIKIIDINKSNPSFSGPISCALPYGHGEWIVATTDISVFHLDKHLKVIQLFKTNEKERITSLLINNDSNLLVGGFGGLELLNLTGRKKQSYLEIEKVPNGVRDFSLGPDNTLFIATWNGCFLYYPSGERTKPNRFTNLVIRPWNEGEMDLIGPNTVRSLFYDAKHRGVWQSMIGGPLIYSPNQKRLLNLDGKVKESMVNAYLFDDDGKLWLGTAGSGLLQVNDNQIEQHFGKKEGLKNPVILDMVRHKNELWLATFEGIQLFDLETRVFENFQHYQGIKELPYNTIAVNEDFVMAGHPKASILFNKNEVGKTPIPPPISIKRVYINGRDTNLYSDYKLSYEQENIQIWFGTIHYSSAKSYDFEYRILEQGEKWQTVPGESGRVDMNGLRPGTYTFQVRSLNSAGLVSDSFEEVRFVIEPAFWQGLAFQLSIALLIGSIISGIALFRIRSLKQQARLVEENARIDSVSQQLQVDLRQAQLSALKAQLNPHFIFNALNSIQEFILLNDRVQANRFLGKFADLMRLTLENSNKKTISLSDEIKLLDVYLQLEGLRFEDQFSYQVKVGHGLQPESIEIPSMLIQPYVENALKHGLLHKKEDRKLIVSFSLIHDKLMVEIQDNGIGRENSKKINAMRSESHKSFAMGANEKRLNLLNTGKEHSIAVEIHDLADLEQNATGTLVILKIPINLT